jgi:protein-tyrosine phosphatase
MENNDVSDISRITENLWIGSGDLVGAHDKRILELRFDIDVDVEEYPHEYVPGVKSVIIFPVGENEEITTEQLALGSAILNEAAKLDLTAYVRSPAGRGRAPTLVAAYLVTTGMNPDQAMSFVRDRRGSVTFSKPQEEALRQFATKKK